MAVMREMIFRIAAMQPIRVDPESIKPPKRTKMDTASGLDEAIRYVMFVKKQEVWNNSELVEVPELGLPEVIWGM